MARLGTIRFRQGLSVHRAVFSPDGKSIVCIGVGHGLSLWDTASGKELHHIEQSFYARSVAFSPDGKMVAAQLPGRLPALFDVVSGKMLAPLADVHCGAAAFAFAADGKSLAAALPDGFALWEVEGSAKTRIRFQIEKKQTNCVAFSRKGTMLATGGEDKVISLRDAATGKEIGRLAGHEKTITCVDFCPDGPKLVSTSEDESLRLWDVKERRLLRVLDGKYGLSQSAVFSPDGKTLVSGHHDGTLVSWDASSGKELRHWRGHSFSVQSVAFSPEGNTLLSAARLTSGPRQWDVATGAEKTQRKGHDAPVDALNFSRDGKTLLSKGRAGRIMRWDLASERPTARFDRPKWANQLMRLSPRGDTAATWDHKDGAIRLWDVAANKERHLLGRFVDPNYIEDSSATYSPFSFSPDGRMLAFYGTKEDGVIVWDVASGKERRRFKELSGTINCVAFSPDGKRIAAGSDAVGSPTIGIWDVDDGRKHATFFNREPVDNLVFSPDGRTIASLSQQRTTHLWNVDSGQVIRSLSSEAKVRSLTFSRDGNWLAGAGVGRDRKIYVWEVSTGQEVRSFTGHIAGAMSVAFAPDGRSIASGGADSTILLWDFTSRMKIGRWQAAKWTPQELEQRWKDLASMDGPRAVQALWDLTASPSQTVPMLRQRIKPVAAADAQHVERLIRDLDSDDFSIRTKATEELEKLVDQAEPALHKKMKAKPSLEMQRRIEEVLRKLEPNGERLRALRAVQVLEYVATPEAREHLRALAKGVPHARLTREATAALARLTE